MFKHTKTNLLLLVARKVAISFRFVLVLAVLASGILYTRVGAPDRAYAATASTLNFQARLLQSNGAIVADGTYNVEFKLYDASTGGAAIWTETRTGANKVTVKSGYLSVYLGDISALPTAGWDQERFLTLNIGGTGTPSWDGEMSPRLRLTAVPYAFQAQRAEGLEKLVGSFTGILNFNGTLGQNTTYTLPDPGQASVNICLSSGNCAGQGGSLAGSGTQGRIAYFDTANGNNLGDGWLFQDTGNSTLELDSSRNLALLGGNLSVTGNGDFTGNLTIGDAAGDTLTINGTAVSIPNGLNVDSNTFVIDATNNRVGIGDATPAAALTVGNGDLFQVNSSGAIAAATGITSSGTITFSGLTTGIVTANGSGVLSSGTIDRNSSTYFTGTMSVANGGTGATSFTSNGIVYGNGTGALQTTAAGANSVLVTNGSNVPSLSQTLPGAVQGNITATGALNAGSITSGFGAIDTGADNISTTGTLQGGTLNVTGNGTFGGTVAVQGSDLSIGTASQSGSLVLNDGAGNTATILSAVLGQNTAFTLPDTNNANAEFCVRYGTGQSNCSGLGNAVDSLNSLQGALTIQGTANEIEVTDNGTDTITIGLPNDVTIGNNLTVTTNASVGGTLTVTSTSTFTGLATFNGGLTVANGQQFTNSGSTLFTAVSLGNLTSGPIGTAAATVDVATTFNIAQTTASQTFTIPSPTSSTAGRIIYINNTGNTSFTMYGITITAGRAQGFIWTGTAWTGAGIDSAGNGVTGVGTLDGQSPKVADGAQIFNNNLYLQTADASFPGLVSTGAQTFAGVKTFGSQIVANAGISLGTQTLQGTTAIIDFTNFDVDASGNTDVAGTFTSGTGNAFTINASGAITAATGITSSGTITFSGLSTGIVTANGSGVLSSGAVDRNSASYFSGTLSVANGGTGATTLTSNGILYGNGTGAIQATTAAANSVLVTDGTNAPSLSQTLPTAVQGNITSVGTLTSGSIASGFGTISTANNITTTATLTGGTLAVTGTSTFTGLATFNGGLTVTTGQNFTVNGDTFTDLTGSGLTVSSGALTVDATSANGFFRNAGNSFGAAATLGTNDGFGLNFETNGVTRAALDTSGNLTFQQATTISAVNAAAAGNGLTLQAGTSTSGTANGGALTLIAGNGTGLSTGGTVAITAGNAPLIGGSVNITAGNSTGAAFGGAVNINAGTSTGAPGAITIGTTAASSITLGNATNNTAISLNSGTGTINIGTGAQARIVNIGTGAAAQTVTIGSSNGASALTLLSGTGGTALLGNTTINTSGTFTTAIGNATGTFSLESSALDISTAGVISGATGITSSGTITFSGLTADRLVATTTGGQLTNTITAANLLASVTGTTGTGNLVFSASPTFTGTVNVAALTASGLITADSLTVTNNATIGGDATVSGGQLTVGTASGQAGSIILYDGGTGGSENTLTIDVASTLGQNTVITFPDPGGATAEVCYRNDNNCGFALTSGSGNYVQFTPNAAQVDNNAFASIFINDTGGGNLLHLQSGGTDRFIVENDGDVTVSGDLAVNGGDITSATSLNVTASNGALTFTSTGATSDIILNSGRNIELQDNTNITGNLDVSGTLTVGTANAFNVNASGAITAATGILSSGTIQFSALSTGVVTANGTGVIASGTLDRNSSTYFTGTLSVANGGTGATTFNTNGVVYYNGTTQVSTTAGANSVLITNGTNVPSLSQTLPSAVQANITQTGALNAGSITSGFGAIDTGADNIQTTGTVQGGIVNATTGFQVNGTAATGNYLRGNGTNFVSSALLASDLSGTIFSSAADTGTGTFVTGDTISVQGGTNGIDTSLTGDTFTINLDTTEIGTTTFGAGSGFTWTFDAGVTDPSIAFASDALTVTAANTTLTGDLAVNGGDLTSTTSLNVTASNGALTLTSTGVGNDIILNSADTIELQDNTNITGSLSVSNGLNVTAGGASIVGNTTIATTAGNTLSLGNATGALTVTGSSASTFVINGITVSASEFNLLDGKDAALVDVNDAVNTAITGTGALNAGSITSGFGSIDVGADAITTTGTLSGGTLSVSGDATVGGTLSANGNTTIGDANTDTLTINAVLQGGSPLVFEGAAADANELTLSIASLTADRTITLPDESGTICLQNSTSCGFALASGSGAYVQFAPASAQSDTSANASIFINDTGGGNLLHLQVSGSDRFVVDTSGNLVMAGDLRVNGNDIQDSAGTTRITLGATNAITGDLTTTGNADFAGTLTAGTSNAFQVSAAGAVTAVGVNSGTGLIQGTGGLTVTGTTNINATGSSATNIGNTANVLTLTGLGINLNTSLLNRVAAGTTTLNLNDTANTTFAIANTGTGVANLTVDGNVDVAGTFTAGTGDAFQVNASGQLIAGSITSGFGAIDTGADNIQTTGTVQGGIVNATTGFQVNGTAATGNYLRGNGTNFVSSALLASDLSGTVFSSAADSGAGTYESGDTITIQGGTNGIDTSLTGDTFTLNLDYTEIGDAVFGNNSDAAIVWGFDPSGTTNPSFTFADNAITLTAATVTLSGDLRVNGNNILDSAGTTRITLGATNTITGNLSVTANLTVDGNTTLGNAAGDTLTITGTAVSIPNNLNFDSNTLYIDAANNRVGVGTATPGEMFHVINSANAIAAVETTSGSGAYALQAFKTPTKQYRIGIGTSSETLFGLADKFFLFDSTANAPRLVVDTNGNMGLGDVGPDAKLEVLATTEQLRLTHTDGTADSRFTVDASGNLTIDNTGTKMVVADDLQVSGNDILDSGATTRITLGATNTITGNIDVTGGITAGTNDAFSVSTTGVTNIAITDANALRVQNTSGADTLFTVDTSARGVGGGNRIKIGNDTGTDTNVTILQVDSTTADITSNLSALNGGLYYNSTDNTIKAIINGAVDELCFSTLGNCAGSGTSVTQSGTNASGQVAFFTSGNNITSNTNFLFDGTNVDIGGSLTVGTANAAVIAANGDFTTAGDIAVNGGDITSSGALNITPGGALTVGVTTQTTTIQGTATSITSNGAGNDITVTSADQVIISAGSTIELQSNANVTGDLTVSGNTTLGDANTDTLTLNGTAVSIPNNLNFDSNTLFIDAANNRVGVGTATPAYTFDVTGQARISAQLGIGSTPLSNVRLNVGGTQTSADNAFGTYMGTLTLSPADLNSAYFMHTGGGSVDTGVANTVNSAVGLYVDAITKTGTGTITNTYGLYINPSTSGTNNYGAYIGGNVGIGDTSPVATLTVGAGDLFQVAGATGNITTAGTLAVNGDSITSDGATLTINAGGAVDIQDALTADSLTLDTGALTFTNGVATDITTTGNDNLIVEAAGTGFIDLNDTVRIGTLAAADTDSYALCRDASSGQLSACDANTTGRPFLQGGNSFGATAVLGTNDAFNLELETAGVTRLTIDQSGNATLTGNLTVQGTGTSSFAGDLTVDGNTTLGNAAGDTLTITGTAVSIPNSLNFDSNTLYIDAASNEVGIGTTSPDGLLHVSGNTNGVVSTFLTNANTGTNAATFAYMQNTAGDINSTLAYGVFGTSFTSGGAYRQDGGLLQTAANLSGGLSVVTISGDMRFYTGGIGDANERLRITNGGNIGVGDTSADYKFEIQGSAGNGYFGISSSDLGTADVLEVQTDADIAFDTSTLFVDATNNRVGVGDTTPAYQFTVGSGDLTGIDSSGNIIIKGAGAAATADLSFGAGANRTINVLTQTAANTAGNNLTLQSGTGNGTGAGGNLQLTAGTGGGTAGAGGDVVIQGGAAGAGSTTAGSVIFRSNGNNKTTAVLIQNSASTNLLVADTTNMVIKIASGAEALSSTLANVRLITDNAAVTNTLRVGSATDNINFGETVAGKLRFVGNARNAIGITISPEFPGATMTADSTSNVGVMTSDFCSDLLGINDTNTAPNTAVCPNTGGNEAHNYYSWTGNASNGYSIWTKWRVPSNFSAFDSTAVQFYGWKTASGDTLTVTIYKNGTSCGTASLSTAAAWTLTNISSLGGCSIAANDELIIRAQVAVGTNGNFSRMGEIYINYLAAF